MKKLLSLILIAAMASSLVACSGSSGSSGSAASEAAETEAAAAQESAEAAPAEAAAEETGAAAADSDLAAIQAKGVLVVGVTEFEPMDYKDADGKWIGFDAEMSEAFAEKIGVDIEFVEIDWDNKIFEVDAGTIDCVWNGMTLTDEVTSAMDCSNAYLNNAQVIVVPVDIADDFGGVEDYADLVFAAEAGSSGEAAAIELGFECTPVKSQADALMEVAAGTSDAALIDITMASAMTGEGTSYADLTYTIDVNVEQNGVGCRQGSDLVAAINEFFAEAYADGSMIECAEKYGLLAALAEQ